MTAVHRRMGDATLQVQKFFLMFRQNSLGFTLCPVPLVLVMGITEKSLTPFP